MKLAKYYESKTGESLCVTVTHTDDEVHIETIEVMNNKGEIVAEISGIIEEYFEGITDKILTDTDWHEIESEEPYKEADL